MLRRILPLIAASVALSLVATWVATLIRAQAESGTFDRFLRKPAELPIETAEPAPEA